MLRVSLIKFGSPAGIRAYIFEAFLPFDSHRIWQPISCKPGEALKSVCLAGVLIVICPESGIRLLSSTCS